MTALILSITLAMLVSCLCSLLEAALLSITPSQVAQLRKANLKLGETCHKLKHRIERPIAVILIVNTAAHTIGAAIAGAEFHELYGAHWMWAFTLAFTLAMVQYTEILPKTLGVRYNMQVMRLAGPTLYTMIFVMSPLIALTHWFNRPFEGRRSKLGPTTAEEISALAAMARSSQQISTRQERIINAVPLLSKQTAEQVMIPVENISFVSSDSTLSDAIHFTGHDFHTRYPVCEGGDRDRVLGYVNFKEVVSTMRAKPDKGRLTDIIRPINFVTPDTPASLLLERFVTQQCHMAIVKDEEDRTIGMVTLEDIVEELLGDLDDEFDPLPRTFYSPAEMVWVVGGGLPVTLLARETHLALPKRMEPVALWFARTLDRPPRTGDTLRYGNAELTVRKTRRGRVLEFNVKKIKHEEQS